uniref:Uncharacterized protein n=1 Tax=Arundo donax TaxID=35708 RepID=A0A0A9H3J2_ARUDO
MAWDGTLYLLSFVHCHQSVGQIKLQLALTTTGLVLQYDMLHVRSHLNLNKRLEASQRTEGQPQV